MVLHQTSHRIVASGITASSIQTQGQGILTSDVNEITVSANVNDVVTLPKATPGRRVTITNSGVQPTQIFPAIGDDLGLGVNSPDVLVAGGIVTYTAYNNTNWKSDSSFASSNTWTADQKFDGVALLSDGIISAPSIAFALDVGTGMFRQAPNVLGFAAGGVEVLRLSNVVSSVNCFNINPAIAGASPVIEVAGTDTDIDLTLKPKGTGKIIIDSQVQINGGNPGVGKVLTSDVNGLGSWTLASGGGFTDAGITVILTNINDNVGIGTSSPNAKLDVGGTPGASVGGFPSGNLHVTGQSASINSNAVITGHNLFGGNKQLWYLGSGSSSNDDIAFINRQSGALSVETLDGAINLRIGGVTKASFTSAGHLHLLSDVDQKHNLKIKTANNANDSGLAWENSGGNFSQTIFRTDIGGNRSDLVFAIGSDANIDLLTNSFRVDGSVADLGNVEFFRNIGIGVTTPTEKLEVNGNIKATTIIDTTIYAQLSSSVDQDPADTNPTVITYNTQDTITGITHSTTVNAGEITVITEGVYFVAPQPQVGKTSGANKTDFNMFLQVDRGSGFVDEVDSNIKLTIKDSDITDVIVSAFSIQLNVGDKIRLMQQISSSTVGLGLKNTDPVVGPPSVPRTPSIIFTMYRIGGI